MKLQQLPKPVTCLFGSANEIPVTWKSVVDCLRIRSIDHPRSRFFQPVAQLDVFHGGDLEALVETAYVEKHVRRSRDVAGVVIGEIDRSLRRCVWVENSMIA